MPASDIADCPARADNVEQEQNRKFAVGTVSVHAVTRDARADLGRVVIFDERECVDVDNFRKILHVRVLVERLQFVQRDRHGLRMDEEYSFFRP